MGTHHELLAIIQRRAYPAIREPRPKVSAVASG